MKIHRSFLIAIAFAALAVPAFAAKGNKKNKGVGGTASSVLEKYDTNKDGKIEGEEVTKLREAFAGAEHDNLKSLDTNGDGKLDDNEVAAIKAEVGKKKKKNK